MDSLDQQYLAALAAARSGEVGGEASLGRVLQQGLSSSRAKWPDVTISDEAFARYLAERTPQDEAPDEALGRLRLTDLYVACGCANGDPEAIAVFDRAYLLRTDGVLRRYCDDAAALEEVKQILRVELLVGKEGKAPRITTYAGEGDLYQWLRVVAVRTALHATKHDRREQPSDLEVLESVAPAEHIAPGHSKEEYRRAFSESFREALARCSDRERNLLRFYYLDGLTVARLGTIYHVHQATAARWLAAARESLLAHTMELLGQRFEVGPSDLRSIVRTARSQLEISLGPLLRSQS